MHLTGDVNMEQHVWVSTARNIYGLALALDNDVLIDREDKALEAHTLNDQALPVPSDICPKRLWPDIRGKRNVKLNMGKTPELFFAKTYWIMTGKAAKIFQNHDLGQGAVYPVSDGFFQSDNKTRSPGDFFCWIYGNQKHAFVGEQSANVKVPARPGFWWKMNDNLLDDDLAISSKALAGPAVWVDNSLYNAVFLSGPLGDALAAARLKDAFALRRCRII